MTRQGSTRLAGSSQRFKLEAWSISVEWSFVIFTSDLATAGWGHDTTGQWRNIQDKDYRGPHWLERLFEIWPKIVIRGLDATPSTNRFDVSLWTMAQQDKNQYKKLKNENNFTILVLIYIAFSHKNIPAPARLLVKCFRQVLQVTKWVPFACLLARCM